MTAVAPARIAVVTACSARAKGADAITVVVNSTVAEVVSAEVRVCTTDAAKVPAFSGRGVGFRVFGLPLAAASRVILREVVICRGLMDGGRRVITPAKRVARV